MKGNKKTEPTEGQLDLEGHVIKVHPSFYLVLAGGGISVSSMSGKANVQRRAK